MGSMTTFLATLSAVTAVASAKSTSEALQLDADQADRDAKRAQANSEEDARRSRFEAKKLQARQRSTFLKGGVTLSGSAEEVLAQSSQDEEIEALTILQGGVQRATRLSMSGDRRRVEASSSEAAGQLNAVIQLVSGSSSSSKKKKAV